MFKTLFMSAVLTVYIAGTALAQSRDLPPQNSTANGGAGARTGYITSTGATVPHPGVPQGAGTTSMDRGIQKWDDKIENSICKGC